MHYVLVMHVSHGEQDLLHQGFHLVFRELGRIYCLKTFEGAKIRITHDQLNVVVSLIDLS